MKKYQNMKIVIISVIVAFLLTWVIATGYYDGSSITTLEKGQAGLWSLLSYPRDSLGYFGNYLLFFGLIGAFYAVLNKTKNYKNFVSSIAKYFKGKEHYLLIGLIILVAILTSVTGATFELFIFFPLVVSVFLLMGYDKLLAVAAYVGASLVGIMGSTYGYYGAGAVNTVMSLDYNSLLWAKLLLLVLPLAILVMVLLPYAKSLLTKKTKLSEEEKEDPLLTDKSAGDKKTGLIIAAFIVMLLLVILGFTSWSEAFGIEAFNNLYTWFTSVQIGEFPILYKIMGGVPAFGNWWIDDLSIILLINIVVLVLAYKIKLDDLITSIVEGFKKMLPVMGIVLLINMFFVVIYNNQFNLTIMNWLIKDEYSILANMVNSIIQSVALIQLPYSAGFGLVAVPTIVTDASVHANIAVIFQAMYGLVMFIAPTSILLFVSLAYTNISYKTWFKYIARFLVLVSLVAFAIIIVMSIV